MPVPERVTRSEESTKMLEIPEFDPSREELVIGTSEPMHYRVIPVPNQDRPTHQHTARRVITASKRLREFLAEVSQRLPPTPGPVRVRYTLDPDSRTPATNLDWSGITLPVELAPEISPLASEIVHHLRTALEYLVFNMVWADTGKRPTDWVKAPCHETEDGWRKSGQFKPLNQLTPANLSALRAVQPFTGTVWLAQLTGLSNPDKHHSPIYVVPGVQWAMPHEMVLDEWQEVEATPRLMVGLSGQRLDFIATVEGILLGLADLANPLLIAEGLNPIEITGRGQEESV